MKTIERTTFARVISVLVDLTELVLFFLIAKNILILKMISPRRGMITVRRRFKYCL